MGLSHTVSKINGDFSWKLQKWLCAMCMCGTTWPISGGCKIITYLESQTPSFLLTVQLTSNYDDDYGLLNSRALPLFQNFQTKNNSSPPEWQAPLSVIISQVPYVVLENHSGGATRPRKKFDDIFIRCDTIPVCDRHAKTAIATMQSVAWVTSSVIFITKIKTGTRIIGRRFQRSRTRIIVIQKTKTK